MPKLWGKEQEVQFFRQNLTVESPEKLFYLGDDGRYYAYYPNSYTGHKSTQQSRNSFIGTFTENFSVSLLQEFANSKGLYAVRNVICEQIGLTKMSPADVAICTTQPQTQRVSSIKAIFEVKMSIVWNWELINGEIRCLGDYRSHKGNPGMLRSDSMLKAIGKSCNIRVSDSSSSNIPIIVLGNTPITDSYVSKVDHLFNSGIIQGFWSVNPNPFEGSNSSLSSSPHNGFIRMNNYDELRDNLESLFSEEREFFSGMRTKNDLGRIIDIASKENSLEKKARKFISLIR